MNDININEYSSAEITAAWIESKEGNKTAIFVVVELIPDVSWMEKPREVHRSYGKIKLYLYQTRASVAEGIRFYETGEIDNTYLNGISFSKNTSYLPTDGYITTYSDNICSPVYCAGINQLLPNRMVSLNVKCIMDNDRQYFEKNFSSHVDKISKYLNETLHITINEYQHLFGSRLLCAQDPIFWKIALKLKRSQNQLSLLFFVRDHKEFNGCHCAIQTGSSIFPQSMGLYEINERVITIPYSYKKSSISNETDYLLIWNSKGALIEKIPLTFFGGKICSTYSSRVLPNGDRVSVWPESYYKERIARLSFIEKSIQHINNLYISETHECMYFKKGERTGDGAYAACRCVQKLLSRGGSKIIICDPYFDVDVLQKYIDGWVRCQSLVIITKVNLFQKRITQKTESCSDAEINNSSDQEFKNMIETVFYEDIKSCANKDCFVSFSIYYAQSHGDKNILHDRHIVIDDNVWGITTSLNSLEKHDTTIFKPQNQEAILDRIKEWQGSPAAYEWRK